MEMGISFFPGRQDLDSLRESDGESVPDWWALKARFSAAMAARRELGVALPTRSGSFDAVSARRLGAYGHALSDVNRTALVDGKPGRDISRAWAGKSHAGA
jgi:hypothetical protein